MAWGRVNGLDVARIEALLTRLPLSDWGRWQELGHAANQICFDLELARLELTSETDFTDFEAMRITRREDRKPLARVVTDASAEWFWLLTQKNVTRISKRLVGELGPKETGEFAQFLGDVFAALGIDAKPSGQVKLWKKRWADHSPMHPADFATFITALGDAAPLNFHKLKCCFHRRKS